MIIYGTRGITSTKEKGEFHCPTCDRMRHYSLKHVRNFFTLYFIPVIPLGSLGSYVECTSCCNTYDPEVLDYNPVQNTLDFEAEYYSAIKKVMIHVLLADGKIDSAEIEVVKDIYYQITDKHIDTSTLRDEITHIENTKEDLSLLLIGLQGSLNDVGKEMVIKAALFVALADGDLHEEEQVLLYKIGEGLGLTESHFKGVIYEVMDNNA